MSDSKQKFSISTGSLAIGYESRSTTKTIAENLDLGLRRGEFVCLLGPNGAGKSTLIRTLAGMQAPLAGSIELDQRVLQTIPPGERATRERCANGTASYRNDGRLRIRLSRQASLLGWFGSLSKSDTERIEWAIHAVDAEPLAGRQISELSDGEIQRS